MGQLTGRRSFGTDDWYRRGAQDLVDSQITNGAWKGVGDESHEPWATSFALEFLAWGRRPIMINKLRHLPSGDWENDAEDVSNLVASFSRSRRALFRWQIVNPLTASVDDLLEAPMLFLNGHLAPMFTAAEKTALRQYVERGGSILADSCCSSPEFDSGFRQVMKEVFPEDNHKLRRLAEEHPVWKASQDLKPGVYELWGIQNGSRTAVIYSPEDLSCSWNETDRAPNSEAVIRGSKVGENIIAYFTGQ